MRLFTTLAFVLVLFSASVSHAQKDAPDASEAKYKDIRTLLTLLNVGPAMRQNLLDEIDQERSLNDSEVPPAFWDEFEKEAVASLPEFIDRLIPVYDGQFTHEEIKNLIRIHQDPVMMKFSKAEQALTEAAGKAGEAWGEELGRRVAIRLANETEPAKASNKPPVQKPAKKK